MKEFKGTPGPWVIDGGHVGAEFNIDSEDGGTSVGTTSQIFRDKNNNIRKANTDLMASAPELLSVLQKIVESGYILPHLKIESQWAIAKALGESQ